MTREDERIEEALRAVGDDYVRRNPADLPRARARIERLRARRRLMAWGGTAAATAAAVAVAVFAWPAPQPSDDAPRPAGQVDLPEGAVPIEVGDGPGEVAVGAGAVWVSNEDDMTLSRIDPDLDIEVITLNMLGPPGDLAIGDGGEVWVANPQTGEVQRADPVTNAFTPDRRVVAGPAGTPLDLAIDDHLWVSVVEEELVQVDPQTGDEVRHIDWMSPVNVAARDGRVFVLDEDGTVHGVDPATGEPDGIEISFDVSDRGDVHFYDGTLWVAEGDGSTLYSSGVALGSDEIESYPFRGTYVEMVQTEQGIVVLSDVGDGTGLLTLVDPGTGSVEELGEIGGSPRDLVRGEGDLWVSASAVDTVVRIPSLP
ncbi:MAG TPA: hypothetical protein VHN37_14470 [Actinomycetota bacterium]|nr:hypothetical protein [Actinomycetota bacterium]